MNAEEAKKHTNDKIDADIADVLIQIKDAADSGFYGVRIYESFSDAQCARLRELGYEVGWSRPLGAQEISWGEHDFFRD